MTDKVRDRAGETGELTYVKNGGAKVSRFVSG